MLKLICPILVLIALTGCSGGGGGSSGSSGGSGGSTTIGSLCTDLHASNSGSSLPCACNSGYSVDSTGTSCTASTNGSGSSGGTTTNVYVSTYSSYYPSQAQTTPCSGLVLATRSILTCTLNGTLVNNSYCSDPAPTQNVYSSAGTITLTNPINPNFSNGTETMTCSVGQTSGAIYTSCNSGYHLEGTTSSNINCYSNTRSCTSLPTGALSATQSWNGSGWGSCTVQSCNSSEKYVLQNNSCVQCAADQIIQNGTCVTNISSDQLIFINQSAFHIQSNSTLWSWGNNANYQLGQGAGNQIAPSQVNFSSKTVKRVFNDYYASSTCAVLNDDSLSCWGSNNLSQLGNGTTTSALTPVTLTIPDSYGVRVLVSSGYNYCAIMGDFNLACWGDNTYGQLGLGFNSSITAPTMVSFPSGLTVQSLVMTKGTYATSCALMSDSSVYCWGYNGHGQVGINNTALTYITTPQKISPLSNISAIYAIENQSSSVPSTSNSSSAFCALNSSGSLYCWGANSSAMVGDGTTQDRAYPVLITMPGNKAVNTVYALQTASACALLSDNSLACWGGNYYGAVGNGSTSAQLSPTAIAMPGGLGVQSLFVSNITPTSYMPSICALLKNSTLACWGNNANGQLGISSITSSISNPTLVSTNNNQSVSSITLSDTSSCLITTSNQVQCAGQNTVGQLGQGYISNGSASFLPVSLGSSVQVSEVKMYKFAACALSKTNTVACWGSNQFYQLGINNTATYSSLPVFVN